MTDKLPEVMVKSWRSLVKAPPVTLIEPEAPLIFRASPVILPTVFKVEVLLPSVVLT